MERPEFVKDEHLVFLDALRESGDTNIFGASPYLREEFPDLTRAEAGKVVIYWMRTFGKESR